jgi:secreted Zn-dependent insulinase-like peptidase
MQGLIAKSVLHQSVAVHKPLCDRRQYQHAELINGVRVLVIQDLDAVYAAASANVQAGYFDDPQSLPGWCALNGMMRF